MESVATATSILPCSIVLVGLMGAGKSKIGRLLAASLAVPYVDSDNAVVASAGMTIASIFELYGEERFRDLEARTIAELLDDEPKIIATGGGAFMNSDTRKLILDGGFRSGSKPHLKPLPTAFPIRHHGPCCVTATLLRCCASWPKSVILSMPKRR